MDHETIEGRKGKIHNNGERKEAHVNLKEVTTLG